MQSMELHLTPDLEAKLNELATETGRTTDDVVQDVMAAYFEDAARVHRMLDQRYDEIESGKVQPVDGEEAFERLRRKSKERRALRS